MSHVYENCPSLENEQFLLRFIEETDAADLLEVYQDKNALPFFNSDNCHGENFYYPTIEKMLEAIKYWKWEYGRKGFVRFSILYKPENKIIGTIELFNRTSSDYFNNCGILRLDVGSAYERQELLCNILSIITKPAYALFDCIMIATKAPLYAIERIEALKKSGFQKSEEFLVGHDNRLYGDYWVIHNTTGKNTAE